MTKKEAFLTGQELDVYPDSEMADEQTHNFDDLWQSIYDIVQLGTYGIVEEDADELNKAIQWLKDTQSITDQYQTVSLDFEVKS